MQEGYVKKMGFFGYEYSDLVWYIARMYTYNGGRVVIVDMTKKKTVMASLCTWKYDELPEEMIVKGVRIVSDYSFIEKESGGIDCVIYCFSYDWNGFCATELTDIIMVTDMMQANASLLSLLNVSGDDNVHVVVRNAIYTKYSIKTLVELTGVGYDEDKVFVLPYDEADYRGRCYMCIDKNDKLKKLSSSMRDVLEHMYAVYFGTLNKKTVKEIFRKA